MTRYLRALTLACGLSVALSLIWQRSLKPLDMAPLVERATMLNTFYQRSTIQTYCFGVWSDSPRCWHAILDGKIQLWVMVPGPQRYVKRTAREYAWDRFARGFQCVEGRCVAADSWRPAK